MCIFEIMMKWFRLYGYCGFLGEFGGSVDFVCFVVFENMLVYLWGYEDVWLGWSYWVVGVWWGDYLFSIYLWLDGISVL